MTEQLSPIERYHLAIRRGDTATASTSLVLAGQLPGYRAEAHLLHAMEAMRARQWQAAFLHGSQAVAALPQRPEPALLVARAAVELGQPQLANCILASAGPALAAGEPAPMTIPRVPRANASDSVVNVLIPVYAGLEQTIECIHSVLRHARDNQTPHHVVVLDDASPDEALVTELQALARASRIEHVRRERNLGFIRNMNLGMAMHAWRDVVWLNSDTRVHGDWLDRLRAAALHRDRIASATPFSNHGELMSFPFGRMQQPMPDALSHAQLDALARSVAEEPPALEMGCGFCMYIRREALHEVGLLDETGLTRGYGEDTDWCLRARAAGWEHVAATSVFVAHAGGVSFGAEKALRVRQNNAVLRRRYPDAEARFDRAVLRDPVEPARRRLQRARLELLRDWIAASGPCPTFAPTGLQSPKRLHIAGPVRPGDGEAPPNQVVLRFRNEGQGSRATLHALLPPLPLQLEYRLPEDAAQLLDDLRSLPLEGLVYARLRGCPQALKELPAGLGLPYIVRCDDETLADPAWAGFAAHARFVELTWRSLLVRYRRLLPGARLRCAAPAPAPAAAVTIAPMAPLLIADSLDQPDVCGRWVALARELARQGCRTRLLLDHPTPWESELLATGAVLRLPRVPGLTSPEVLRLAGCAAAASLDQAPGAGWVAPAVARQHGLALYAPGSAVAREAEALPLPLPAATLQRASSATHA